MEMEMEMEVIAWETIKPFSPASQHLRVHKLSSMDQVHSFFTYPVLFFYTTTGTQHLKALLSENLSRFYLLAGQRRAHNLSIKCNNEGVDYSEIRVIHCTLSSILSHLELENLAHLYPAELTDHVHETPLLLVQANFFPCGAIVFGMPQRGWWNHLYWKIIYIHL